MSRSRWMSAISACLLIFGYAAYGLIVESTSAADPPPRRGQFQRRFGRQQPEADKPVNIRQTKITGDKPDATATAAEIDRLLGESFTKEGVEAAQLVDDATFLRRAYLDLNGTIPTSNELTLFALDANSDKRRAIVERLLEDELFGSNWGAFFREVVFSRATDERARIAQLKFENWLTEQFNANTPWDKITSEILTAAGNTSEDGRTAFLFAHTGQPEELAGETSRIFLGIQMQCANCHDHPYDSWKREQFHELAAFFPRVQVRRNGQQMPPEFIVASNDAAERMEAMRQQFSPEQTFKFLDRNSDGKITKAEGSERGPFAGRFDRLLENGDTDQDKAISLAEFQEVTARFNEAQPGRGSAEHYMQDLDNPQERGKRMEPVFFISDQKIPIGTDDIIRRDALSKMITDPGNEWFAKAFVNRIWFELLGEAFYPIVDDIGPERHADHAEVLETLSKAFVQSRYDVKWLMQTIMQTDAYQRQLGERQPAAPGVKFAAAVPVRLRSDQIYTATKRVLGVEGLANRLNGRQLAGQDGRYMQGVDPGRIAFFRLFNFDPSTPQDELLGNVPQALFMMNSTLLSALESGRGFTMLARTLRQYSDDNDALAELYLRTLSREPSDAETEICLEHLNTTGNRQEGFEDILWSLLNSSEFLTKR